MKHPMVHGFIWGGVLTMLPLEFIKADLPWQYWVYLAVLLFPLGVWHLVLDNDDAS